MSDLAQQLADDFRSVIDEAIDVAENCTPEQWEAVTSEEGWTVAATVHHIALGNQLVADWIEAIRAGDEIEGSQAEQDEDNARHAEEYALADQRETAELLRTSGADTEAVLRSLTDEDLGKAVAFGPANGHEITGEQAARAGVQHARSHLDHAESASGYEPGE